MPQRRQARRARCCCFSWALANAHSTAAASAAEGHVVSPSRAVGLKPTSEHNCRPALSLAVDRRMRPLPGAAPPLFPYCHPLVSARYAAHVNAGGNPALLNLVALPRLPILVRNRMTKEEKIAYNEHQYQSYYDLHAKLSKRTPKAQAEYWQKVDPTGT